MDRSLLNIRQRSGNSINTPVAKEIDPNILKEAGQHVYDFADQFADLTDKHVCFLTPVSEIKINLLEDNYYNAIIQLKKINDFPFINKYFETVNAKLPVGGKFITCVETKELRKRRILHKYPYGFAQVYYFFDFIFKRVFPKLPVTKRIYYYITGGKNRVLSKTESMGRIYSCGFKILEEKYIQNRLYFACEKVKDPAYDEYPSYGPIYRMKRIGKDGKFIYVFKLRTMHAFSEYLQEYIYEKNDLKEGGKFANDFRVSRVGKFFRRYWLDELPMILNVFNGDMKIVGVRPLSKQYMGLYSADLQERRKKFKPGLIPPFYVDLPKTLEEIMESEQRYLDAFEKSPFLTDIKYFFLALYTIIFKKARSN